MQVTETEIILPIKINTSISFSRRDMISTCLVGIFLLGAGIFFLVPHGGLFPSISGGSFAIFLIALAILFLLLAMSLFLIRQREILPSPHFIRIDHEGVFFSYLFGVRLFPTAVVRWSEIATLVPYTLAPMGRPISALGIVPHNPEAIVARMIDKEARNFFSYCFAKYNAYLSNRTGGLTPLNIPQAILPISIDELCALIQERFAAELQEHHVTISGHSGGLR